MADMFGKEAQPIVQPVTADKCVITWDDGGAVAEAVNFSLEYGQQITRRRSIGNRNAIIYGSQPQGRATMTRLVTVDSKKNGGKSWTGCVDGSLTFHLKGGCGSQNKSVKSYRAVGCIVSSFSVQASAEDLTVADNVVIEFMELYEV